MGKLTQEQFEKNLQSILEYARTTEEPLTLWDLDRKKRDHGPNSLTDDRKTLDLVIKEMTDSGEWYKQRLVAE